MSYPVETDKYGRAIPPIGQEILYCDLCGDKITPTTIAALLHHLETKHPEEKQAISTLRRLVKIRGSKAEIITVIKCPWGCGWEGSPDEYVTHLETCPKKTGHQSAEEAKRTKDWRFVYVSPELMDKLSRFQVDIDGETFRKLFTQVGGTSRMADHLWEKFHVDYNHKFCHTHIKKNGLL